MRYNNRTLFLIVSSPDLAPLSSLQKKNKKLYFPKILKTKSILFSLTISDKRNPTSFQLIMEISRCNSLSKSSSTKNLLIARKSQVSKSLPLKTLDFTRLMKIKLKLHASQILKYRNISKKGNWRQRKWFITTCLTCVISSCSNHLALPTTSLSNMIRMISPTWKSLEARSHGSTLTALKSLLRTKSYKKKMDYSEITYNWVINTQRFWLATSLKTFYHKEIQFKVNCCK